MREVRGRAMSEPMAAVLVDADAREQALDVTRSFLVQAPAGSGKTELLTRRFLKLLTTVNEPEEILAITFTRAATAEMRNRILDKLTEASREMERGADADALAAEALRHAEARGWRLLEQPQRLNIQTIDSLCLSLAHGRPLLARLGGKLAPSEHAEPMYASAARRTLERLASGPPELRRAIEALLELRDSNLGECQRLIAQMLARRDQWARTFPLVGPTTLSETEWAQIRENLERPFRRAVEQGLARAASLLTCDGPELGEELLALARYACSHPEIKADLLQNLRTLQGLRTLPDVSAEFVAHWRCICEFLTKEDEEWRRMFNKNGGFPTANTSKDAPERQWKLRMVQHVERLASIDGLREALGEIRRLPPSGFEDEQWVLLRYLFITLRDAVAQLKVVFAEENAVDFIELGMAAEDVLRDSDAGDLPTERGLERSERYRHILVDEFQDTSRRQHELLQMLVRGWEPGDGRTYFLVGDPMQSIYIFRQAEVELFAQVEKHGVASEEQQLPMDALKLKTNFRSDAGIVNPLNQWFDKIFSSGPRRQAVPFTRSAAREDTSAKPAVHVHAEFLEPGDSGHASREEKEAAAGREAAEAVGIVQSYRPWLARRAADGADSFTIGILGRAKHHLAFIAKRLREAGIVYRAVELETLGDRQEILDLKSLTRALLHPMDRVAWLSVLRAPWCGLELSDLHRLTGSDNKTLRDQSMLDLLDQRIALLTEDGAARATRVSTVLRQAFWLRFREGLSFSAWVERTWMALGGPQCVDAVGQENSAVYFQLLDGMAPHGMESMGDGFDARLEKLFAQPDPSSSERHGVQLMTIHKAKGLGFDVVLLPALGLKTGQNRQSLICSLERASPGEDGGERELLVAPIGSRGATTHDLYKWVQRQISTREDEERKRLLYVACTRARSALHVFGTVTCRQSGDRTETMRTDSKSLLRTAWPALEAEFRRQRAAARLAEEERRQAAAAREAEQMRKPYNFPLFADLDGGGVGLDIAATAETPRNRLRRLPSGYALAEAQKNVTVTVTITPAPVAPEDSQERPHASRQTRAEGTVIHALLERLASRSQIDAPASLDGAVVDATLGRWREEARLLLREAGLPLAALDASVSSVLRAVKSAISQPIGQWILGPREEAQTELSWTGWIDGALRTIRVDRMFRAGAAPFEPGNDYLWIIDYKTSEPGRDALETFFASQRALYATQIATYGNAARLRFGEAIRLRLGLYYPLISKLDHWEC